MTHKVAKEKTTASHYSVRVDRSERDLFCVWRVPILAGRLEIRSFMICLGSGTVRRDFHPMRGLKAALEIVSMIRFFRENLRFLSAGMVLTLNSSFGQTFFISIFAAQIMSIHGLSNGEWGLIYTAGTTASAVVMFWAGALTDRFRARTLAWFIMPGLAMTCLTMALSTSIASLLGTVFFLRFLGQGMIYQMASVSMARWFLARRGMALSVAGMGIAAGQAVFPVAAAALLLTIDWQSIWIASSVFILICFPLVLWLLGRERTPQSLAQENTSVGMEGRHWTRAEVLRSGFFWTLVPLLLGPPAWGTALLFQQVHIAQVKGWPLIEYLALLPVMTIVSVGAMLGTGALIDRFGSGRLLQVFPLTWIAGFVILGAADTLALAFLAFVAFGFATGMQVTLITVFWAEYFGTRHIGAIKATSASIMVLGSAVGPGVSGFMIDFGFDFPQQMWGIALYFALSAALVCVAVERATAALPQTTSS